MPTRSRRRSSLGIRSPREPVTRAEYARDACTAGAATSSPRSGMGREPSANVFERSGTPQTGRSSPQDRTTRAVFDRDSCTAGEATAMARWGCPTCTRSRRLASEPKTTGPSFRPTSPIRVASVLAVNFGAGARICRVRWEPARLPLCRCASGSTATGRRSTLAIFHLRHSCGRPAVQLGLELQRPTVGG